MSWKDAVNELTYLNNSDDPDIVTLLVGEGPKAQEFCLSKNLLQLSSVRFKTLLSQNEKEYFLPDLTPNTFDEIVQHIYTLCEWEFNGNAVDACNLLKAALEFELEELTHNIHKTISELSLEEIGLTCDTACFVYDVIRTTSFMDEGKLKNAILSYICKNAQQILILNSFLSVSHDVLLEILREDDLQVDSELDVFKAVISWGMNILKKNFKCSSPDNLQAALREPLNSVRFSNMSNFEFKYYVQPVLGIDITQLSLLVENSSSLYHRESSFEGSSLEASAENLRIYSQSFGTSENDLGPSTVDILQAELYVTKFTLQVETSVLKSKLSELKEETRRALASQESSKIEVEAMATQIESLKKEMRKDRREANKTAAESKTMTVLDCEWRSFIRDSMILLLGFNETLMVVIQNNSNLTLHKPCRNDAAGGYCEMPKSIAAFTRGQFGYRKECWTEGIVLFSYSASIYNLIVGVRTESVDEFALGFDRACNLNLDDKSLSSNLYSKLRLNFRKDQDNNDNVRVVATVKFQPYLSFTPVVTIRASMIDGVLKILIFQD